MTISPACASSMNEAEMNAVLVPLYLRTGGRGTTDLHEMLHRIADNGSHLLRVHVLTAAFEAAVVAAVKQHGAQMGRELRVDLLGLACEAGYETLAAALLDSGIAWRPGDAYQCTALAIQSGKPSLLALLLRAGIEASLRGECGMPLLSHAIASGDAAMVTLLRDAGARAEADGAALAAAAITGQLKMLRMCLEDGASLAALGDALDLAVAAGQAEAAMLLLQAGAPTDPALRNATQRHDIEMVNLICTARAGHLLASGAAVSTPS